MFELSLHILDIVQNSIRANTQMVEVTVDLDTVKDLMRIRIVDNGSGMDSTQKEKAADPFFTTRTTRKVGLGLSYYKMMAEMCGGSFNLESILGEGTTVEATFQISHIDRMPLGNMGQTMALLAGANPDIEFLYQLQRDNQETFVFDTVQMKEVLDGVSINTPEIIVYIEAYINENTEKIIGEVQL